jgi:hypothetical protein
MEHAFDAPGRNRGSLSAGRLLGDDRAFLLVRFEGTSARSSRLRFSGPNAQPWASGTVGLVDVGRRLREAAAIAPVTVVSSSSSADRAHGLTFELDSLARAA